MAATSAWVDADAGTAEGGRCAPPPASPLKPAAAASPETASALARDLARLDGRVRPVKGLAFGRENGPGLPAFAIARR